MRQPERALGGASLKHTLSHSQNTPSVPSVKINQYPKYNDIWATVLFVLNFLAYASCTVYGLFRLIDAATSKKEKPSPFPHFNQALLGIILAGSSFVGFLISFFYLLALYRFAGKMIAGSMILNISLMVAAAIACFVVSPFFYIGIIFLVLALVYSWVYYRIRQRIPFSKILLKTVTGVLGKYPATVFTGFVGMVLQLINSISVFIAVIGIAFSINDNSKLTGFMYSIYLFLAFCVYWNSQVVKNVVHVTVSGLFATYYFMGISTGQSVSVPVSNPTAGAAKRALTTSFGSICFGSLLIALMETLRMALQSANQSASDQGNTLGVVVGLCASCILGWLSEMVEYFNHYAFTQVSIYGKPYCDAAKDTWNLLKARGLDILVNDLVIGTTLSTASFMVLLIGSTFGALMVYWVEKTTDDPTIYAFAAIFSSLVMLVQFSVVSGVIESGVSSTIVCLAEDPNALQKTKPELYEKIRKYYPGILI